MRVDYQKVLEFISESFRIFPPKVKEFENILKLSGVVLSISLIIYINYFDFSITDKGVIPNGFASKEHCEAGTYGGSDCDPISTYINLYYSGDFKEAISDNKVYDVTWWVINMGNMDYLRCGNDLNWTTKTSCK